MIPPIPLPTPPSARRRRRPFWIHFTHWECAACGRTITYQERVYDRPKPDQYHERHEWNLDYCYCDAL